MSRKDRALGRAGGAHKVEPANSSENGRQRTRLAKGVGILGAILVVALICWRPWKADGSNPRATTQSANTDRLLHYVRERFGIPENVKLSADPYHDSASPDFYETSVTMDDGNAQHRKTQTVYVTKDGRFLAVGGIFALSGGDAKAQIISHVREFFKVPASTSLSVGETEHSTFAGFSKARVSTGDGKGGVDCYLTRDDHTLVLGNLYSLTADPRREVMRTISTVNQPGTGPEHAPVTIVEYADLECPSCAKMHQFLETDLIPKYGDKVHVIFKEFPLVNIHQWSYTAALADECAYQINPRTFLPYRTLIFQHQQDIDAVQTNPITVRDLLLGYAQQSGIDRVKLATCLDEKASEKRVQEGMREGEELTVSSTPTFFVNGKILVGIVPPEDFYRAVDEALAGK